jgi:N-acyl-D-amino-acid deacylase
MGERWIVAGVEVVDGSGGPPFVADVHVDGERIVAVDAPAERHPAVPVIDGAGRTLTPGFVDVHSHADNAPLLAEDDVSKLTQGVTTEVTGNCGMSLAPRAPTHAALLDAYLGRLFPPVLWSGESFGDWLEVLDARGYVVNVLPLVGHGTVRVAAMGFEARAATATDLVRMRALLEEALDRGAGGLSSGLLYPPGRFADTEELVRLAAVMVDRPALYATHMRDEGAGLAAAVDEALAVGREGGVRVELSHLKRMGRANWGTAGTILERVQRARAAGQEVYQDVYPYTASSTMLAMCLPPDLSGLNDAELLAHLERPETLARVRRAIADPGWDNHVAACGGYGGIRIGGTADGRFEGETLAAIADRLGVDGAAALITVLREERLQASMVAFGMDEADMRAFLADPFTAIGSDGLPPGRGSKPHPRLWGTFPRVLGLYARDLGVMSFSEAVRRMTSLPAQAFRLGDIGRVAPGYRADLVLLERERVGDRATYDAPTLPARGIRRVWIGGREALRDGRPLGVRAGRRLRAG